MHPRVRLVPDRLNRLFVTAVDAAGRAGAPATVEVVHDGQPLVLDDSFLITVGDQTVQADAAGTFRVANIPAPDLFGPGGPGTAPDFQSDEPGPVSVTLSSRNLKRLLSRSNG